MNSVSVKQSDEMIKLFKSKTSIDVSSNIGEESSFDIKKGLSIYLKILLNYLQLISIVENLELKWPFYAKSYLNVYTNMGSVSTQTVSLECILNDLEYNVESLYVETIFSILLPFITFFIALSSLIVLHFLTRRAKQTTRFIVIVIVASIFLQPTIVKMLYKNMICKKIDSDYFLSANLQIECESDDRNKWLIKNQKLQ